MQELKGGHVIAAQQKQLTRTGSLRFLLVLNYTVRVFVYSKVFFVGRATNIGIKLGQAFNTEQVVSHFRGIAEKSALGFIFVGYFNISKLSLILSGDCFNVPFKHVLISSSFVG